MTNLLRLHPLTRTLTGMASPVPRQWFEELEEWLRTPFAELGESLVDYGEWAPTLQMTETDDAYRVAVDLAGVAQDSITLDLQGELLTVAGERPAPEGAESFLRREIPVGKFRHQVRLPSPVDADAVQADYKRGVLTVTLPKKVEAGPRRIAIRQD